MKKFDYYYAYGVGKVLNASERVFNCVLPLNDKRLTKKLNIPYGKEKLQKLDLIYKTEHSAKKRPILFYLHGGGFISGTTVMRRHYCCEMANAGYFVVNLAYRLAPEIVFPESLRDIYKAIDYVLDRCSEYNLNKNQIVFAGESAGAYLASYVAVMCKDKSLYLKNNIDFQRINDFNVSATVLINGIYSVQDVVDSKAPFCNLYIKAFFGLDKSELHNKKLADNNLFNPLLFMNSNFPPTIVIRGNHDMYDLGTQNLIEHLEKNNAEHVVYNVKGIAGMHAVSIIKISKEAKLSQKFTMEKLKEYLSNQQNV